MVVRHNVRTSVLGSKILVYTDKLDTAMFYE
jgi:hypothetical protein